MFQVGDVIGSFTILAHLRTGGMASLYLARRSGAAGFARLVAIKVVHPRMSEDPDLVRMFVDEAKLTARIDHPNVVHVEELGEAHGTYFLVMEYVHGCSLAQLMRALGRGKRRLSPSVAVAICARVAEGLHAAHETTGDDGALMNLVHRDVSPQNILLSHKGHVKLIDFGIAKAKLDRDVSNTMSLKGKVRYMAPEQAALATVDRRTDVYALGIVLWELLTMRRLFSGRTEFEILMQVRKPPRPVPPSRYATDIPKEVDEVVLRALDADPEDRFANAKELRRALVRALPRAAGIDSAHLADLLVNVMGEALDQERHELPQDVSRVLRAEQARVAGLEESTKEALPVEHLERGTVEAYTLHSVDLELQFEDDDSPAPEPTQRQERPPEVLAPPPIVAAAPSIATDDDSPTEVVAEASLLRVPAPIAPPSARTTPLPAVPPPRRDRALAGYGVALGCSIALGVGLALWGPSCGAEARRPGMPATAVAPAAIAAPSAPPAARSAPAAQAVRAPEPPAEIASEDEPPIEEARRPRRGRARPTKRGPTIVGGVPIAREL